MTTCTTTAGGNGPEIPRSHSARFDDDYPTRLRRARLGMLVAATPILMLFISFTSAYVVRQGLPTFDSRTNTMVRDWVPIRLPPILIFNTCLLLLSTATMEVARRQVKREIAFPADGYLSRNAPRKDAGLLWLSLTTLLGLCFLAGQWRAWQELEAAGFYVATSPSSSFFYLLTGAHALHLTGGILVLVFACVARILRRPVESSGVLVDVSAWYWHLMAGLWLYIWCLLTFAH